MTAHTKPTQADQIAAALLAGEKLTPLDCLRRFGCLRAAARVHELRTKRGMAIETEDYEVEPGTVVARYYLASASNLNEAA